MSARNFSQIRRRLGIVTILVLVALSSPAHRMKPVELTYNFDEELLSALTSTINKNGSNMSSNASLSAATNAAAVADSIPSNLLLHLNETVSSVAFNITQETPADRIIEENSNRKIVQISLLGERNSGTNWMSSHLQKCFDHALIIRTGVTRFKHWFQYEQTSLDPSLYDSTLVLAQFRNPYHWLMAMMHVPHHMPEHHLDDLHNDWKLFLTKQWIMPRTGKDLDLMRNNPNNYSSIPCRENYLFRDLVSCAEEPVKWKDKKKKPFYSEHNPFYEMRNDASGVPYDNIMQLRSDKITNFLSVAHFNQVAELWTVHYEDLLQNGTASIIQRIVDRTGVQAKCKPYPPQPARPTSPSREITKEFVQFIQTRLNWTTEAMIGYYPKFCLENGICI